jgi:O-acetyl-ADP-ribose deacetylase (regulator of RNase III)
MGEGQEDHKLKQAVENVLQLASQKGFSSISMPAISSGIFGFPKERCAKILVGESKRFLEENQSSIQVVEFCLFDDETLNYFEKELDLLKKEI